MTEIQTIEQSGYEDGFEAGITSGVKDIPANGWDGDLVNAIGFSGVCKLFGVEEQGAEWENAMAAYVRGCKRGVEDGAKSY